MTADPGHQDVEALGLLGDLQGRAREERAELVRWLLARGFDVDQIRSEFSPLLLPAIRLIGDDGVPVSPREISESSGVSLELLQRLHRAAGLVRAEDPDARVAPEDRPAQSCRQTRLTATQAQASKSGA